MAPFESSLFRFQYTITYPFSREWAVLKHFSVYLDPDGRRVRIVRAARDQTDFPLIVMGNPQYNIRIDMVQVGVTFCPCGLWTISILKFN